MAPHVQVGLAHHQTREKWALDIKTAQCAGIDGFALNIGPSDHWTERQLEYAYREAEQVPGFSMFISFE
jgi:glucan endo-1,3-alpha-glucosidase